MWARVGYQLARAAPQSPKLRVACIAQLLLQALGTGSSGLSPRVEQLLGLWLQNCGPHTVSSLHVRLFPSVPFLIRTLVSRIELGAHPTPV